MAAPSKVRSGVGLRHVDVLLIAADGYIAATGTTAYEGQHISGAKTMGLNPPAPRNITHTGDDVVYQLDSLPPNSAMTGTLVTGKINDTVDAVLTDDNAFTVGEANLFGLVTDNQGDEQDVVLIVYYQTRDTDPDSANAGERLWEGLIFPKARLIPRPAGPNANAQEVTYDVVPNFVTAHAWGTAFSQSTEGFTRAQCLRSVSTYKPKLIGFNGDNSCTAFVFPTDARPADTNKAAVFIDGTLQTTGYVVGTTQVTFAVAPGTDANINVFYEYD